jgi:hypothetical protein
MQKSIQSFFTGNCKHAYFSASQEKKRTNEQAGIKTPP